MQTVVADRRARPVHQLRAASPRAAHASPRSQAVAQMQARADASSRVGALTQLATDLNGPVQRQGWMEWAMGLPTTDEGIMGRQGWGGVNALLGANEARQGNVGTSLEYLTNAGYQFATASGAQGGDWGSWAPGLAQLSSLITAMRLGPEAYRAFMAGDYNLALEKGFDFLGNAGTAASPLVSMLNPAAGAAMYGYSWFAGKGASLLTKGYGWLTGGNEEAHPHPD